MLTFARTHAFSDAYGNANQTSILRGDKVVGEIIGREPPKGGPGRLYRLTLDGKVIADSIDTLSIAKWMAQDAENPAAG